MKTIKSQIVLFMLEELILGNSLSCDTMTTDFHISQRTFMRYIAEIRAYLCNFYRNKEIIYDSDNKVYILK